MDNQTIISANRKEILEGTLFRERAEYINPENRKILGVTARTKIIDYETYAGSVKMTLKTTFRMIYKNDDGSFGHDTVDVEQAETITSADLQPSTFLCMSATVTDAKMIGGDPEATVLVSGWYIVENKLSLLNACIPGLQCKTGTIKAENVTKLMPGGLSLTYTDESRMNVKSLLDYCPEVTVSNVYPGNGSYRIEGDVYVRILAQSEDGQCFGQLFSHTFSTEVFDEKVTTNSDIDVDATVKSAELSLAEGDKRLLITDISLGFCGCGTETVEAQTVTDAYSIRNEIDIKSEEKTVNECFCLRTLREKASSRFIPENGINELFGVLSPCVSASFSINNGSVSIEGVIESDILYLSGKDEFSGQKAETPFKILLPIDYKCESRMQPQIVVTNVNARLRNGEVDLLIELIITVKGVSSKVLRVLSSVEIGAPKEEDDYAVCLYIVRKDETLWDVAKALNTSEEILLKQNPDVPLPLGGGERVILYKELPF